MLATTIHLSCLRSSCTHEGTHEHGSYQGRCLAAYELCLGTHAVMRVNADASSIPPGAPTHLGVFVCQEHRPRDAEHAACRPHARVHQETSVSKLLISLSMGPLDVASLTVLCVWHYGKAPIPRQDLLTD